MERFKFGIEDVIPIGSKRHGHTNVIGRILKGYLFPGDLVWLSFKDNSTKQYAVKGVQIAGESTEPEYLSSQSHGQSICCLSVRTPPGDAADIDRGQALLGPKLVEQTKQLVESGYDRCAEQYTRHRGQVPKELADMVGLMSKNARFLDVGCGGGKPVSAFLSRRGHVTGVDVSEEQIRLAKKNVPTGEFIKGDILTQTFEDNSFDVAICLYTMFHLPRATHKTLFERIAQWIKPGGLFFVTVAAVAEEVLERFFGALMFWSSYSLAEYERLLRDTGFEPIKTGMLGHGYRDEHPEESHPYYLARRIGANSYLSIT